MKSAISNIPATILLTSALSGAAVAESENKISAQVMEDLLKLAEKSSTAFMSGDMRQYISIFGHDEKFTLFQPFGGPASRGFDRGRKHLEDLAGRFRNGKTRAELVNSYSSGDMAFLAVVEHQNGEVNGLPNQQWPLRVTFVFRKTKDGWVMLHRHADPLLGGLGLQEAADLARRAN